MASSNWKWKPIDIDIALYACLSNIHVVATKAKYIRVVIVATEDHVFFCPKMGISHCHFAMMDQQMCILDGFKKFKKKCAGVWWPLGPIFFLQSWRSQGAGNQEMFRVRPKNDHWIIFMVYHPASAVSEWLSSTAFCGWWMEFQMFQIQFPDFPISHLNGAVCTTGIHFF